jgi:hypothetical protein
MSATPLSDRPRAPGAARTVGVALLGALMLATAHGIAAPREADARSPSRASQHSFMWALGRRESGGNYRTRNKVSGAYGKYQIMPANWPSWAGKFLGDRRARQTPANQERVAYRKVRNLYRWLGSWRRVAYWWLTGSSERREHRWSSMARGYVNDVMRLRSRAPRNAGRVLAVSARKSGSGSWRRAMSDVRLRFTPGGRMWRQAGRGRIDAGRIVKVRKTTRRGNARWLRVVTRNGRVGWVNSRRTVVANKPARAGKWSDVRTDGRRKR